MKKLIIALLAIGTVSAFADTVNVKVEYCRGQYGEKCGEVSKIKATKLLASKGFTVIEGQAPKTISILLDNGCRLFDLCQDESYIERGSLKIIANDSKETERTLKVEKNVWPRTSKALLDDLIDQI
jgi:hypothetical protein